MKTALIPGSFDPITLGHIDVIKRCAGIFDRVIVAVMTNDSEKYGAAESAKKYMFSLEEREMMARLACAGIKNVEVISAGGLLIDLFDKVGADVIVKGVRDPKDLEYENLHASWNKAHNPRAETLYLPATDEKSAQISSTLARKLINEKKDLSGILPESVVDHIKKTIKEK